MKWKICENYLEQVFHNMFNSFEIVKNTGGKDSHKGDFIIQDSGIEMLKGKMLQYVNNAPKTEVDKFKSGRQV